MAAQQPGRLGPGTVTPICSDCGIALCWDLSDFEYEEEKEFWDEWRCSECDPDAIGSRKRWRAES